MEERIEILRMMAADKRQRAGDYFHAGLVDQAHDLLDAGDALDRQADGLEREAPKPNKSPCPISRAAQPRPTELDHHLNPLEIPR